MNIAVNFPIQATGKQKPEKIRPSWHHLLFFTLPYQPIAQLHLSVGTPHTTHKSLIRSDEGLNLETSASEFLYGGQFTLSTRLIKPNYLVILPPTQHHSFFRNLPPLFVCRKLKSQLIKSNLISDLCSIFIFLSKFEVFNILEMLSNRSWPRRRYIYTSLLYITTEQPRIEEFVIKVYLFI